MPFTKDDFLSALDLPEEHPYTIFDGGFEMKPWSVADYFGSVTSNKSVNRDGSRCPKHPSWETRLPECSTGDYNNKVFNVDKVSFFREIKPCLTSMCRMAILLWAPVILLLCIKRLTTSHRHYSRPDASECCSSKCASTVKCSTFGIGTDVMKKNSLFKESTSSDHANQTLLNERSETINKYNLAMMPFFANFLSVLSSSTPMFSIEDKVNQQSRFEKHVNVTRHPSFSCMTTEDSNCTGVGDPLSYIIALIVSAVIMTDAMYILQFSQTALLSLHVLIIAIGIQRLGPKVALSIALPITAMSLFEMQFQDYDLPTIQPGLYYSHTHPVISKAVESYWPVESRTYEGGTPWMLTGDTRTGLPFLLYSTPNVQYTRRWVPLPEEQEALILDIAFPHGAIEDDRSIYLVIHGINGHSNEGYVLDFANQQVAEGHVVAVMVTRGLMDSPVLGQNLAHFARTSDLAVTSKALKSAIRKMKGRSMTHSDDSITPMLTGVGFSMGAITLANYVARSGQDCALDAAIGFSGALDTREQVSFKRSASLWQPFIAKAMRDTMVNKYMKQIENKFDRDQYNEMMRAESLVDLDRSFFAPYNDYNSLYDYYSNTGAMGDFESFDKNPGRIANVSIPLLMVQSLDDPVGTWRAFHEPDKVVETGNGNTIILFTEKGGHVGWPLGLNPRQHGWRWMNDLASSFTNAIRQARHEVVRAHE